MNCILFEKLEFLPDTDFFRTTKRIIQDYCDFTSVFSQKNKDMKIRI